MDLYTIVVVVQTDLTAPLQPRDGAFPLFRLTKESAIWPLLL